MRIGVVFGGHGPERDVSIASAGQVIRALRKAGHDVVSVDIASGRLDRDREAALLFRPVGKVPPVAHVDRRPQGGQGPRDLKWISDLAGTDLVFLALHGGAGEDGRIQAVLEVAGLPYTGSGPAASAVTMDKDLSKCLLRAAGIPTPDWLMAPVTARQVDRVLGFPVIVKPSRQGSTVGLTLVEEADALADAVELATAFDNEVLVESFVGGREFTVGILEGQALPVGEIVAPGAVFDYRAKYQPDGAREVFPAEIDSDQCQALQELAVQAHRTLKLGAYSRVDFRCDREGRIYCLEVNSLPGLTATSLLPKAAAAAGIGLGALIERICASPAGGARNGG